MIDKEKYEKIAENFLKRLTEQDEKHILEVIDNNKREDSISILSKDFRITKMALRIVYSRMQHSGKIRDKNKNKWSEAELITIKSMVDSGHYVSEISSSLHRCQQSIKKKIIEIYGFVPLVNAKGEKWRKVEGLSDYEVSNLGRIRNIKKMKLIKGYIQYGYICVNINKKQKRLHRLVAEAFLPNPDGKEQVDHLNGDTLDNRANNLRWVTPKENSNNQHRLTRITESAEKKRVNKEIDDLLKCIFEKGISKSDLIRKVLDYKDD